SGRSRSSDRLFFGRDNAWMTFWIQVALLALNLLLLLWLVLRPARGPDLQKGLEALQQAGRADVERLERGLRAEVQTSAQGTRQELNQTLGLFQQTLTAQSGDVARTQNEQID